MRVAKRLTVELIAQPADFIELNSGHGVSKALEKGLAAGYDFMPVTEAGRLIGISSLRPLTRGALASAAEIRAALKPVEVDRLVALDTPILEVLRPLQHSKFLLCLGRDGVRHVVTLWDLAQPAASQLAFGLALVVEGQVAQAIDDSYPTDAARQEVLDAAVGEGALASEARAWEQRRASAAQIAFGRSLTFGAKLKLLSYAPEARNLLKARSRQRWAIAKDDEVMDDKLRAELGEICHLRNKIGHDTAAQLSPDHLGRLIKLAHDVAGDLRGNDS
jgi:hypothetical protein